MLDAGPHPVDELARALIAVLGLPGACAAIDAGKRIVLLERTHPCELVDVVRELQRCAIASLASGGAR